MKARRQLSRELFIPPSPDRVALVCLHCLCGRITCHEGTTCLTKKRSRPACFYPKCLVQGARRLTTDLHCAWGPQTSSNGSWYFLEDRSGRFGLETNALGRANSCKTCIFTARDARITILHVLQPQGSRKSCAESFFSPWGPSQQRMSFKRERKSQPGPSAGQSNFGHRATPDANFIDPRRTCFVR